MMGGGFCGGRRVGGWIKVFGGVLVGDSGWIAWMDSLFNPLFSSLNTGWVEDRCAMDFVRHLIREFSMRPQMAVSLFLVSQDGTDLIILHVFTICNLQLVRLNHLQTSFPRTFVSGSCSNPHISASRAAPNEAAAGNNHMMSDPTQHSIE